MRGKIALKNVKRSIRDYSIYFFTLTLAVCIFYAFNSIDAQGELQGISNSNKELVETMSIMLNYVSVLVSVILCGLILYANNFIIKRRKKEIGLYMSLGMGKKNVSMLLVLEEIIIGIGALITGIVSGVCLAQILYRITSKLFELPMISEGMIVSNRAIVKTTIYFTIIFIIVMIFNVFVISKYKLITLMKADRQNEKVKIKNSKIAAIITIMAVILIGIAYRLVLEIGLDMQKIEFKISIILGILGTALLFYGVIGFIILILEKMKKIYYKKLNIFTSKQINSKVNTNFVAMTIICLMLFVTISSISVAVGYKNQNLDNIVPVDGTIRALEVNEMDIEDILEYNQLNLPEDSKTVALNFKYMKGVDYQTVFKGYLARNISDSKGMSEMNIDFLSVEEYNDFLTLIGEKTIKLKGDEVVLIANITSTQQTIRNILEETDSLEIKGKKYKILDRKVEMRNLSNLSENKVIIVGNKELLRDSLPIAQVLNINSKKVDEYIEKVFTKTIKELKLPNGNQIEVVAGSKTSFIKDENEFTGTGLYITIYVGIVFLIASAAVLALQQLSEASDSLERYRALRKIGANKRQINKSIFIQTAIYFILPIFLAVIHSIIGIRVGNDAITVLGAADIVKASVFTMVGILSIYFMYFMITYIGYKNIVREK